MNSSLDNICLELEHTLKMEKIPEQFKGKEDFQMVLDQWESHEILRTNFPKIEHFLTQIISTSYGLMISDSHIQKAIIKPDCFTQKVDMFRLIEYLNQNYVAVPANLLMAGAVGPKAEIDTPNGPLPIRCRIEQNFWNNIFNDYADYKGANGKGYCIFNKEKHALASYLHSASQNILYWNFRSEENNKTLCTAIILYGKGRTSPFSSWKDYYILEGLVGNLKSFGEKQKQEIHQLIWSALEEVIDLHQISRNHGDRYLFLNTEHSGTQEEPEEFLAYAATKNSINGWMMKKEERQKGNTNTFVFNPDVEIHQMIGKDGKPMIFTHEFIIPSDNNLIQAISLKQKGISLYKGEQYLDTFYAVNRLEFPRKEDLNAFVIPGGYAQGIGLNDRFERIRINFF